MATDQIAYDRAHDLLIAGAFDLGGDGRSSAVADRIAQALLLGQAGDVHRSQVDGAFLATRRLRPARPGQTPRIRASHQTAPTGGAHTLLAGTIHHPRETCERLGVEPRGSPAADYAAIHLRYGDECDRLIAGNYVAVQWFPEERRVRIARAPTGNYPLHVWRDGDFLVVGSIPRVLFAAGAPTAIDPAMLGDRLLMNPVDHRRSWYLGHERVPVASREHHDRAGVRRQTFFRLSEVPPVRFARDEDYVEAVDEQMARAVDASLEGTDRCAIWLSGGLDSQAVASYAATRTKSGGGLHAFTSVPMAPSPLADRPNQFSDESHYVQALAAMYPGLIHPHFLKSADYRFDGHNPSWLVVGSWPIVSEASGVWADEGLRAAAALGCDTMLSGGFGNMTFSYAGKTGYPTWLRQMRLSRLWRELGQIDDDRSILWRFGARALIPNLPARIQKAALQLRGHAHNPYHAWSAIREDFARSSGALDRFQEWDDRFGTARIASAHEWRQFVWEVSFTDSPELQVATQLVYGVQERDPTGYFPLMKLCAGIPDEQYLRDGQDRWLARRLLRGKVPEEVRLETRIGRQGADWPLRFDRERAALRSQVLQMMEDDVVGSAIDLERLLREIDEWPGSAHATYEQVNLLRMTIGVGLTAARFVRYSQGRNVG